MGSLRTQCIMNNELLAWSVMDILFNATVVCHVISRPSIQRYFQLKSVSVHLDFEGESILDGSLYGQDV